jgi:hypothetical protein
MSLLCLGAVGNLHRKLDSHTVLTADLTKIVLDTLNRRMNEAANELEWRYSYLSDCASRCTYALTENEDYRPLDDPEAIGGLFETVDDMMGYAGSQYDSPEYKARRGEAA